MAKATEKKLNDIYDFMVTFTSENSYPPSIRELCQTFEVKSTATMVYYLEKLEKMGFIKRAKTKNRAIELLKPASNIPENGSQLQFKELTTVPVVGKVAAGSPILAVENIEEQMTLPIALFGCDQEQFILNVSGDSMINAGILTGDKIIVKKQETAENGEIVVAMIDGNSTVKRFFKEEHQIRLQPENDFMEPIYTDNATILGKVIGLIRTYK